MKGIPASCINVFNTVSYDSSEIYVETIISQLPEPIMIVALLVDPDIIEFEINENLSFEYCLNCGDA